MSRADYARTAFRGRIIGVDAPDPGPRTPDPGRGATSGGDFRGAAHPGLPARVRWRGVGERHRGRGQPAGAARGAPEPARQRSGAARRAPETARRRAGAARQAPEPARQRSGAARQAPEAARQTSGAARQAPEAVPQNSRARGKPPEARANPARTPFRGRIIGVDVRRRAARTDTGATDQRHSRGRASTLPPSAGVSSGFLNRRSQVRVLPGALPTSRLTGSKTRFWTSRDARPEASSAAARPLCALFRAVKSTASLAPVAVAVEVKFHAGFIAAAQP
jgi:hypothetical protein